MAPAKSTAISLAMGFMRPTSGGGRSATEKHFGHPGTRHRVGTAEESVRLYHPRRAERLVPLYGALNGMGGTHLRTGREKFSKSWGCRTMRTVEMRASFLGACCSVWVHPRHGQRSRIADSRRTYLSPRSVGASHGSMMLLNARNAAGKTIFFSPICFLKWNWCVITWRCCIGAGWSVWVGLLIFTSGRPD